MVLWSALAGHWHALAARRPRRALAAIALGLDPSQVEDAALARGLFLASACQALPSSAPGSDATTDNSGAPQAGAFDVVDGCRLRLRARDGAAEVELGAVARGERRLLVVVHAGRTYVGIDAGRDAGAGGGRVRR